MKALLPALSAVSLCTVSAAAEPSSVVSGLSAARLFEIAGQAEQRGDAASARNIYSALEKDPDRDIRNEARFRHGQLQILAGNLTEAATLYRAILDEKADSPRIRLELAALLAQMGDLRGARQQLRQAQSGGLPPDIAQVVNQYVAALRSFKAVGGSLEVAIVPDSNINHATDAKTLDTVIAPLTLSRDAREKSGLGLKGSGQIYGRVDLGKDVTLVPRLSGQGLFYKEHQFDDLSGSAQLGLEWRSGRDRITPSAGHTWRWYGGDLYARTQSLTVDWLHAIGKRSQIDIDGGISRAHYARNRIQDGVIYNIALTYERALTARSGGNVALSANRQTARDPGYATASGGLSMLYWHDLGKTTLFATIAVSRLEADERLFLYPDRRKEFYLRTGFGAAFRQVQVKGFSPLIRIAYERNGSTVGIYDYRRITTDIGITRAF